MKVQSSMDSIERVGSKLTHEDFKDFLRTVSEAFPSGTEEYEYLSGILLSEKTDLGLVKKLFELVEDRPEISDDVPYGFSWELLTPTDTGKSIFKKMEELDPESAHDLYEFMSYQYMQSSSKMQDDVAGEDLDVNPEELRAKDKGDNPEVAPEFEDVDVARKGPALSKNSITRYESGKDFIEAHADFAESADLTEGLIDSAIASAGPVFFLQAEDKSFAWHPSTGFVDSNDCTVTSSEIAATFSSIDEFDGFDLLPKEAFASITSGDTATADSTEEDKKKDKECEDCDKSLVTEAEDFIIDKDKKAAYLTKYLRRGNIVMATGVRNAEEDLGGKRYRGLMGSVMAVHPNAETPISTRVTVLWCTGKEEEIPVLNINQVTAPRVVLFQGVKMALLSSFREHDGKVSFIVTCFARSKKTGSYHQVVSGRQVMSAEQFASTKLRKATRVYSGKALAKVAASFPKEGMEPLTACKSPRIARTFVSQKAAVVMQSGPYGLFAAKVPVVFASGTKRYSLFKKIGASYLDKDGNKFPAIMAARYGKPKYLMVAASEKKFFAVKSRITCNAMSIMERTNLILQRKRIQSSIQRQRDATAAQATKARVLRQSVEAKDQEIAAVTQNLERSTKLVDTLNNRIVASRNAGLSSPTTPEDLQKINSSADRTDRLASLMARL
jgi:hypothetical protein